MKLRFLEAAGFLPAAASARLSYNSASDGFGQKDLALLSGLAKRGDDEGKALRMMVVWMSIQATRQWWSQMDTYRVGVEKGSQSTMHTLLSRETTLDDYDGADPRAIAVVNEYIRAGDKIEAKKNLPESFLQTRVVMISYQTLRRIYAARKNHELAEWHIFCDWIAKLPYANPLIVGGAP